MDCESAEFIQFQIDELFRRLEGKLDPNSFNVLSGSQKDRIQAGTDEWPIDHHERGLSILVPLADTLTITKILLSFLAHTENGRCYVFLMGLYEIILEMSTETLIQKWMEFIDADGEEIICYRPGEGSYISIERNWTQQSDNETPIQMYHVVCSNERFKYLFLSEGV